MEEAILRQILNQLGDLAAMYRLVNRERIVRARDEALGEGTRRQVWEHCDGKATGGELAKALKVTPQRISQILGELSEAGMVSRNEEGKYVRRLE